MKGWSHNITPPENWDHACSNFNSEKINISIGEEIIENTLAWYPRLLGGEIITVDAGAIFAYGKSDVNVLDSRLHDRTHIGVYRRNNYFSIDPGKLTTAPMFAVEAVKQAMSD